MGAEIQRLQRKRRNNWQRVTNELVITFALKDCERCEGAGFFTAQVNDGEKRPIVCACCDAPFKKAYEGRLRRLKNGMLEFKPLAVAAPLDEPPEAA